MKCPYIVNTKFVSQETFEYDTDGRTTFHQYGNIENKEATECNKEQCAAWQNNKCIRIKE